MLGIDTPDDRTAVFRLKRPYSPLLQRLDVVEASIIPRHQYEGQDLLSGAPTRSPIGTGPFRFVSYAPGNNLVLERNPDYFRKGLPGVDRLVFRIFPNPAMSVAALEKGDVDYVGGIPGADADRLRKTPGIAVVAGTGVRRIDVPGRADPEQHPQAVQRPAGATRIRARHRPAPSSSIASISTRDARDRSDHPSPVVGLHARDPQYPHDVVAAQRLLDEAGFKAGRDGERFAITFTHAANQQRLGRRCDSNSVRSASR